MTGIDKRAMIVRFGASQWTARKYDRKASKEVSDAHNAPVDAGRYNKQLIAKKAIFDIQQIVSEARRYTDDNTLPWDDKGGRILSVDNYFAYTEGMRLRRGKFEAAISGFLTNYPALIEQARADLNGLFNEKDYPTLKDIQRRFDWRVDVFPIPSAGDFRVELDSTVIASIQSDIEQRVSGIIETAQKDIWSRLYKVVKHMADSLETPDKKFHDTLVGNIIDVCQLLPKLNITKDPKLEEMRIQIESKLTTTDPDALRKDKKIRNQTAASAQEILDTMAGFMGGVPDAGTTECSEEGEQSSISLAA